MDAASSSNRAQIEKYVENAQSSYKGVSNESKSFITQLSSEERSHLLQILSNTKTSYNEGLEKSIHNKMTEIKSGKLSEVDRDAGKNRLQRATSNISRATQNILGTRKSTGDTVNEIKSIAIMKDIGARLDKGALHHDFFNTNAFTEILNTSFTSKQKKRELDAKNDYKLLGVTPNASKTEVDKAFIKYLNENTKEGKDRDLGISSYKKILLLKEAETLFQHKLAPPLNLTKAKEVEKYLTPENYQKAMNCLLPLALDNTVFPNAFNKMTDAWKGLEKV